ncbi:MAG: hypothetical protein NVSMB12_02940 [Acidimicrobiales bacterium]
MSPLLTIAVAAVLAVGVWFRFWTRSHLWLDEALTVHIASLPLRQIPDALRHDGAPPLYYFLLHLWMRAAGSSSAFAARSFGGVLSVATLPVMWLAGRRLALDVGAERDGVGPATVAWTATVLLASSPFAVHFATEARMYSLVVLLVLVGYLALAKVLRGGRRAGAAAVGLGLSSGLLLVTHYWALYLLAVVACVLAFKSVRPGVRQHRYRIALGAIAAGGVVFVPWLPAFFFQTRHTGTPWAEPASFSAMVNAISEFAGGRSSSGRALGLLFFALAGFGLLGAGMDGRRVEVDLRTRPRGRGLAIVVAGTLAVAITIGLATHGAFAARYTSVVFPPFVLLVVLGTTVLHDPKVRVGVLSAAAALGLLTSTGNIRTDRTQVARLIATARSHGLGDGDLIVYCPDQLGPAGTQVAPGGVRQVTFPTLGDGRFVDWVDYGIRNRAADPVAFADSVDQLAGAHAVWIVWAPEYRTFGTLCEQVVQRMGTLRPPANQLVASRPVTFFEHANLVRYPPR